MDIMTIIAGLLLLAFGAAFGFFGYRYFRFLLPVWGFIAGFWISELLVAALLGDGDTAVIIGWIAGLAGGIILAFFSYTLFNVALVILGASFGLWFVAALLTWIGLESGLLIGILAIGGAILFAILTFERRIRRYLVIVFSALIGALSILSGLMFIFGDYTLDDFRITTVPLPPILQESTLAVVLWLLLAAVAVGIQLIMTRDMGDADTAYQGGDVPLDEDLEPVEELEPEMASEPEQESVSEPPESEAETVVSEPDTESKPEPEPYY